MATPTRGRPPDPDDLRRVSANDDHGKRADRDPEPLPPPRRWRRPGHSRDEQRRFEFPRDLDRL